jgi:primosomal protein N' (replication factor Y) (superfamily II helicase)
LVKTYLRSHMVSTQNILFTNTNKLYATVIIPLYLPTTYTWSIPIEWQAKVQVGQRVEVQLRNKKYAGIISHLTNEKPLAFEPKDILNVLDDEPTLYLTQLAFWKWLANYYMCSEGEVMQAAMPANLKLNSESILIWNDDCPFDLNDGSLFSDNEYLVAQALEIKKELKMSEVQQLLDATNTYPVIKKLIDKKVCYLWEELKQKFTPKTDTYILLNPQFNNEEALSNLLNNFGKAPKQMELLLGYLHLIKTEGEVAQSALLKKTNASASQLKSLIDKQILQAEKRNIDRIKSLEKTVDIDFTLNTAQETALQNIKKVFETKDVCLLHGVTASGKTHVYIKLIQDAIEAGNQALFLLPEIALTTQIIRRLQKHFGGYIAIYHSKFNPNERVEIWNKVKSGDIKIVLGARSAIFLPYKNLKLIVVDEEHDASYKQQDPAPRYHARDAAIYYASTCQAKVLLGSATPSVETYYNCTQHKYGLVELMQRHNDAILPTIELVDLKQIPNNDKSKIALTPQLIEALHQTIAKGKQAILFQNRRGYSPYIQCQSCGWIPQCNQCDVTLTFHKAKNKLSCHYCSSTYPVIQTCAACGSHQFKYKNFGTEKLEELVAEHLPQAKVARMDWDTVKGKNDHDTLIKLFEQHRIDVLVGTQMVVKGLDFEHVDLVGIVDADGILSFTDFRVNERAFQLMEQVSGRAGRKTGNAKVLVQVSNLNHPVLHFVKTHDYKKMFVFELESRKAYKYPPYTRVINITIKHKINQLAEEAAHIMYKGLEPLLKPYLQGPAQPPVDRIRNQFLWDILLKLPKDGNLLLQTKKLIEQQIAIIKNHPNYKASSIVVDVDFV